MKKLIAAIFATAALGAGAWDVPLFRVSGVVKGVMGTVVESSKNAGYAANADTAQVVRVYSPETDNPYGLAADVQKVRDWVYDTFVFGGSRYLTATASPGDPFETYAALTNALATHSSTSPTIFYNGAPAAPNKDDWCVVLHDESHLNAQTGEPMTTRWGFVGDFGKGGKFQFQITLSDSSVIDAMYAIISNVSASATNYTDRATNALDAAHYALLTNVAASATNYTDAATNAVYEYVQSMTNSIDKGEVTNIAKHVVSTARIATSMLTNAHGFALVDLKDEVVDDHRGSRWTQSGMKNNRWQCFGYGNGRFVAGGMITGIWYSDDAVTWTRSSKTDKNWYGLAYGNGRFVAASYFDGLWYSDDGATWTQSDQKSFMWYGFAFGNGRFVAGAEDNGLWYSDDGATWTQGDRTGGSWRAFAFGNGRFVAGSLFDGLWYSDDGATWTRSMSSEKWQCAAFGGGVFLAGCASGTYRSDDGATWTKCRDGDTLSIAYGDGRFVAVSGSTWYSDDGGLTWTKSKSGSGFKGITYGNDRFVAGGENIGIWYSVDVVETVVPVVQHVLVNGKAVPADANNAISIDVTSPADYAFCVKSNAVGEAQVKAVRFTDANGVKAVAGSGNEVVFQKKSETAWEAFGGSAAGSRSLAVGSGAEAQSQTTAIGFNAKAVGASAHTVAVGGEASTEAIYATALGNKAKSSAREATAVGYNSFASGDYAVSVGGHSQSGSNGVAGGGSAKAGNLATAVGGDSEATHRSIALGCGAKASVMMCTALGFTAMAGAQYAVALGYGSEATNANALVIGDLDVGSRGENTINFGFTDDPKRIYFKNRTLETMIGDATNALDTAHRTELAKKANAASVTAATKCKITYNAQGVVTAGADISASDVPSLDASKITSGTFADARIPSLAASKITSGTLSADRIPSLAASKITSGTFADDRIPSLAASKITSGTFADARIASAATWNNKADKASVTAATKCKITYNAQGIVTGGANLSASDIPSLAASKITSGKFTDAFIESASWDYDGVQLWSGGPYFATCNVGATSPGDTGHFFFWGASRGYVRDAGKWVAKFTGNTDEYVVFHPDDTVANLLMNKSLADLYNGGYTTESGTSGVLKPEYDAASSSMSGSWRMPTSSEMSALVSNCTFEWTSHGGVRGYRVTGKGSYASRSIFLPAAGYGTYGSNIEQSQYRQWGAYGRYWCANPVNDATRAYCLGFTSGANPAVTSYARWYGLTIRPVRSP